MLAQSAVAAAPNLVNYFTSTKFTQEGVDEGKLLLNQNEEEVGLYSISQNRISFAPYDSNLVKDKLPAESLFVRLDSTTGAFNAYIKSVNGDSSLIDLSGKEKKKVQKTINEIVK